MFSLKHLYINTPPCQFPFYVEHFLECFQFDFQYNYNYNYNYYYQLDSASNLCNDCSLIKTFHRVYQVYILSSMKFWKSLDEMEFIHILLVFQERKERFDIYIHISWWSWWNQISWLLLSSIKCVYVYSKNPSRDCF